MFFGRDDTLSEMQALWGKRVGSLVTCRGRRRIGKSTLIEEFARRSDAHFINIEGIRPDGKVDNAAELFNFMKYLALRTETAEESASNWAEAFQRLDEKISDDRRTVVLLDEISWMGHFDDRFSDDLRIAWESRWKKHDRLIVVLCGSVSSWIKENIVDNRAYMGRRSADYVLGELPLCECVKFWGDSVSRTSEREIFDVLSITGGIPRYLEEINPSLTADENIRLMCFRQKSPLRIDFDEMFRDVIVDQSAFTERVLRCLVCGPKTATELAKELGVAKNGHISAACERLAEAGFVSPDPGRNPESGALVREVKYRLRDNYTRFYLKYIEPVKSIIDAGSYEFVSLRQLDEWNAVTGLAFENLIVNHYREFLPALGLANALVVSAAPYRKGPDKRRRTKGCQIDLLIQTKQTVCLVEIKRRKSLGNEVVKSMDAALSCLSRPKGVSFRTALVYSGSLAATVRAGGYFNATVDVGEMLGIRR